MAQGQNKYYVTGSSGWLAGAVIDCLKREGLSVVGVSRSAGSGCISNDAFLNEVELTCNDVIVHLAFCRQSNGASLVESIEYSSSVFEKALLSGSSVINASSQSVYGSERGMAVDENSELNPNYLYALAKASSEILLDAYAKTGAEFNYTNLRLASLIGVSKNQSPNNVVGKFIDSALAGETIKVIGGSQMFSFLDIEDAAGAIVCLIRKPSKSWKSVYTITPNDQVGIVEVAKVVADSVSRYTGEDPVPISIDYSDIKLNPGGSNALAKQDLKWTPKVSFEEIIEKMVVSRARQKESD